MLETRGRTTHPITRISAAKLHRKRQWHEISDRIGTAAIIADLGLFRMVRFFSRKNLWAPRFVTAVATSYQDMNKNSIDESNISAPPSPSRQVYLFNITRRRGTI